MITKAEYRQRVARLKTGITGSDLDAFIVSEPESIYYFTGATYKAQERPFFIVVRPVGDPVFLVPKLEEHHMQKARIGDVLAYWEYPSPPGRGWTAKMKDVLAGTAAVGVEPGMSVGNWHLLKALDGCSPVVADLVASLRLEKSPAEIKMIREASRYADRGMTLMISAAYYGISVVEMFALSKKLQLDIIRTGEFDPLQTEFLTATWPAPHSAKPHAVPPVNGKLKDGPLAAMCYLRVNGYAAECERTFFLACPDKRQREMFNAVQAARRRAFEIIKPGVRCADVDAAAMGYLKAGGYGDFLLHRTGHGIGQGNHEGPWIAAGGEHVLAENMVISVEPGIYIPDIGGVRHSDTVLVTKDGYECLTTFPDDLESLTIQKNRRIKKLKGKAVQRFLGI